MGQLDAKAETKIFQEYIADKKILIGDPNTTSRTALASLLTSMGAKMTNLSLAENFTVAEDAIAQNKPQIIICEYDFGKKCGLELLQRQRAQRPEAKKDLFILVTGNTSQTAVAKSAEEDIDSYILKPFTGSSLRSSILRTAMTKIKPPEYMKTIDQGKDELAAGKIEDAMQTFVRAKTMDPAPSLACFYHGQAELMKQALDNAEGNYLKGLQYNKIHYKCLVGLYELLMKKQQYTQAYEVIKRISQYFPANPERLASVLRLAIMTQSYEDVERYYQIFINIDERQAETVKYICAALVVCGKYYLRAKFPKRALELFQKAAVTAAGRTKILREIITALATEGMLKDASEFMKRFPPDAKKEADFYAMDFLILSKQSHPARTVDYGRELIAKGIHDPLIYQTLIKMSAEAGLKTALDDLMNDATKRWPDQKDFFLQAAQTSTPQKS